jgi:hypothetical protein
MMYWLSRSRAPWLGTFGYDAVIAHAPHTSAQQLSALDAAVRGGGGGGGRLLTSPPPEWGGTTADGAELPVEMSVELPIGRVLAEQAAVRGQTGWAAGPRGGVMIPRSGDGSDGGGGGGGGDGESGSNPNWRAARQATACFMSSGGTAAGAAASHVAAVVGEKDARAPWATAEAVSVAVVATAPTATTAATLAAVAATATTASSATVQTRAGGRHAAGGAVPSSSSSTARRLFHAAAEPELLPVPPGTDLSQGRTELASQQPWPPTRCQPQERHEVSLGDKI